MNLSMELDLSIPGIKMKSVSKTTLIDDDGGTLGENEKTQEIDLGELKDERVNFLYDEDVEFFLSGPQFRYKGREVIDLEDPATGEELIEYPGNKDIPAILPIIASEFSGNLQIGSTLSVIKLSSIASSTDDIYNGKRVELTFSNEFSEKRTITDYVGSTKLASLDSNLSLTPDSSTVFEIISRESIPIKPAHEYLMDGTNPGDNTEDSEDDVAPSDALFRNALVDRIWLSSCGFWNNGNYNLGKFVNIQTDGSFTIIRDNKDVPWVSIKNFKRRIQQMREILIPKGIEIQTTIFSKTVDENGVDINDSGLSRRNTKTYSATKIASENFMDTRLDADGLPLLRPIKSDDISPFDVSIQTIQKSIETEEDELYSELIDSINQLIDNYTGLEDQISINEGNVQDASNVILPSGPLQGLRGYLHLDPLTSSNINGEYNTFFLEIISGKGTGQKKKIIDHSGDNHTVVLETTWTPDSNIPDTSSVYKITLGSLNLDVLSGEEDLNTNTQDIINLRIAEYIIEARSAASRIRYSQMDNIGLPNFQYLNSTFNELKQSMKKLDDTIKQVLWFEFFQGISLKNSKISCVRLTSNNTAFSVPPRENYKKLARILIPIDMGTKVQKLRKKRLPGTGFLGSFGRRYKYIRTDLGIRFAEIRFIDTSILTKYRKNESAILVSLLQSASVTTATFGADADNPNIQYIGLSIEIMDGPGKGQVRKITNYVPTTRIATIDTPWDTNSIPNSTSSFIVLKSYEPSNPDPIPSEVNVTYEIPHLPYDRELRRYAFDQFGLFNNETNSSNENIQDITGNTLVDFEDFQYRTANNEPFLPFYPGYEIFKNTSKSISDMRAGMDIYKKIQFLLIILRDTFGTNRVKLIETIRSFEDQNKIQFGGETSGFLSWHNYGLAVKIIITDETEITPIKDGSDDFFKLLNIAEVFTNSCFNGQYGEPLNIVWCGRLKTGPDLFVWEFLPIGVDHKDALKFRDSMYNQIDPVLSNAWVNVTKLIVPSVITLNSPYIKENSSALANAIRITGRTYVPPNAIVNYDIPRDLVLKDVQEFLFLIRNKFISNGSTLAQNKDILEWKINNPVSFKQLMIYHSILGNYGLVRNFLAIDYVDTFESMIIAAYQSNPIAFVKSYLGETSYNNIKINVRTSSDSGYISLVDNNSFVDTNGVTVSVKPGTLFIKVMDVTSNHPEGNGNTFGQKQISPKNAEIIDKGFIVSSGPVITENQIKLIHIMIRDQILSEYKLIKDSFLNLQTNFLHDSVNTGSNAELADLMENEFGVIKTQDLIPFDQLKQLFNRIKVNTSADNSPNLDGTIRGLGVDLEGKDVLDKESIYESLISTLSDTGIQFVKPGKEKIIVEELQEKPLEVFIKLVTKKKQPDITDLL